MTSSGVTFVWESISVSTVFDQIVQFLVQMIYFTLYVKIVVLSRVTFCGFCLRLLKGNVHHDQAIWPEMPSRWNCLVKSCLFHFNFFFF
jgi:hypothetical protein